MTDLHLTSASNPRLKQVVALRRRRVREESGTTVVEGYDELALALDAGVRPRALYCCDELMLDPHCQRDVVERARSMGSEIVSLSRAAFEKVAYREGPDGFLAVVPEVGRTLAELELGSEPFVLVCEGVEKPGNLGAMLRTADAAGVTAVIAADPVTDWGNPNVIRASKGTVFSVPVASASSAEVLQLLREHRVQVVATTPDTETEHTAVSYRGAVAIAVGTEKQGLTGDFLDAADERVRIPMAGAVNSLNVSTAAAVVVYEAVRQRSSSPG